MSRRSPVWVALALIIGILVNAAPVAAAPDRRPPTTPGQTAHHRVHGDQCFTGVERIDRLVQVLVLHPIERWRLRAR